MKICNEPLTSRDILANVKLKKNVKYTQLICDICHLPFMKTGEEILNLHALWTLSKRFYCSNECARKFKPSKPQTRPKILAAHLTAETWDTYYRYYDGAIKRNLVFELTVSEIHNLITNRLCSYCNNPSLGIDRADNNQGYITENCIPCCKTCNWMKNAATVEEFIGHCKQIAALHS